MPNEDSLKAVELFGREVLHHLGKGQAGPSARLYEDMTVCSLTAGEALDEGAGELLIGRIGHPPVSDCHFRMDTSVHQEYEGLSITLKSDMSIIAARHFHVAPFPRYD